MPRTSRSLLKKSAPPRQNQDGPLRVEHGRYVNFIADFMKANEHAAMSEAIAAWNALKKMDVPKTYQAWLEVRKP
jgi:hypothetical protein